MKGRFPLFALAVALCGCAAGGPLGAVPGGGVETVVRVTWKEAPAPGVRVEWRNDVSPDSSDPPRVATTDARGVAACVLPPGRRFLLARWAPDGNTDRQPAPGDRFAFFGGNPVYLSPGPPREIQLALAEVAGPPAPVAEDEPPGAGGVAGVVTADGVPLGDANVFAYLRTGNAFRDMGFAASAPTGPDGRFSLELPPGRYYIVARKRAAGGVAGPLRKGDAFGYLPANPVDVAAGAFLRVTLPATTLRLRNIPAYAAGAAATAFVEGRILGVDGKPRRGVHAALYDNPDLLNRPVFMSDVSGDDGRFRLPVPVPGVYWLGARSGYGGSPTPGDLYGRYEGNADHTVEVRDGDRLTGFDVVVSEVR